MLVNEAETDVRAIDPDLKFDCVTVVVQPSVAQLVERLTVVLYSIFGIVEINWSLVRFRPLGKECGECDDLPSRNFTTMLCNYCIGVRRISQSDENGLLYAATMSSLLPASNRKTSLYIPFTPLSSQVFLRQDTEPDSKLNTL